MQERGFKLIQIPRGFTYTIDSPKHLANFSNHVQHLVMNELAYTWNLELLMKNRADCALKIHYTILSNLRKEYNVVTFQCNLEKTVFDICNEGTQRVWLDLKEKESRCRETHSIL